MAVNLNQAEERKARELERLRAVAGEVDRPGSVGMVLVPDSNVLTYTREYLLPLVHSPMRMYSQTGRRAEFANGSSVLFRHDSSIEVARGYRLNWVWIVAPKDLNHVEMWRGALRNMLGYARGRFYVGSTEMFTPTPEGGLALEPHRRA
jgi:hypothetical protein